MFQQETDISFNDMPKALAYLIGKVDKLETLLSVQTTAKVEPSDRWFNLQELCEYLPDHPAKQTVYGWITQRAIPYHKTGKKLQFRKSEIDEWIQGTRRLTASEQQAEAIHYINSKKGGAL